jgi:hypothetical protein
MKLKKPRTDECNYVINDAEDLEEKITQNERHITAMRGEAFGTGRQ